MGYKLKLDIYYFSLKKITEVVERVVKGGETRTGYRTENDDCMFSDFVKSISSAEVDSTDYMKVFLDDFINGFNEVFKENRENTQAISLTPNLYHGHSSLDYTAWGSFMGGPTGIHRDVYKSNNAKEPTGTLDTDNVASLYYFYKIWLPIDSNTGIIMVQSYTSAGCTSLFKEQFEEYFISKGYKPDWGKCIPDEYIKGYLKEGYVNEIQVIHKKRDDSDSFTPVFKQFTKARTRTILSSLQIPFSVLISTPHYKSVLKSDIKAVDISFDEDEDIVKLYYKDENGAKAHASLANIENILPTITLDDSLKDTTTQFPKWNEIHNFTKNLLEKIKLQIGYTPKTN
jgi:hypothetical protein